MVSRSIEICIKNQNSGTEEVFSMRPNLRRFEYFKEDLLNRRPDLRYQPMKMYYQSAIKAGSHWVKSSGVPEHAVIAGRDVDGSTIYAGRAFYSGHYIAAKVIPNKRIAYVPWKGHEHAIREYEFLCGTHFEWVKSSNGHVPPGAVCSGKQVDGLPLYVGRANIGGSLAVGKVHTRYNCIYVPFNGREHSISHYDVLVERRQGSNWMQTDERYPVNAVVAGYDIDGSTIYVGRAYHNHHYIPAKVILSKRVAYVSWGGDEHIKRDYELLGGSAFQWVQSSDGHTPPRAVIAGREEGVPLYIGRAHIAGSLCVGKVHEKYKFLFVPYNGIAHSIRNYEILVELGSNFGGNNVYINDEMDFSTFLNQNISKVFVETTTCNVTSSASYQSQYNVTSSASYSSEPRISTQTFRLRHNVNCTGCGNAIYDIRYKCMECRDVNLCMECEPKIHKQHMMVRITNPNDEPIVSEKVSPTNQAWTKIDEAEVKETRKHTNLDADFHTELMRLGIAGLKILLDDTTESVPAQPSQPSRHTPQTQSPQNQFRSAPQSMSHTEPHVITPLYPVLSSQPNLQSLPRTTYEPTTQSVTQTTSEVKTQMITQNKSTSDFLPTAPPILQPDERVNNGLKVMTTMGFSNEGGWLTKLLESVDGNIGKALDLLQMQK